MENIEIKIREINNYFISKMLSGDYEITEMTEHVATVKISGYKFNFWVSNNVNYFDSYDGGNNFMQLSIPKDDKIVIYEKLKKDQKSQLIKKAEEKVLLSQQELKVLIDAE